MVSQSVYYAVLRAWVGRLITFVWILRGLIATGFGLLVWMVVAPLLAPNTLVAVLVPIVAAGLAGGMLCGAFAPIDASSLATGSGVALAAVLFVLGWGNPRQLSLFAYLSPLWLPVLYFVGALFMTRLRRSD